MNITEHVTYRESTKSITALRHGICNHPGVVELKNMRKVSSMIFEPMRKALGGYPIFISSFYRSPKLNKIIGGSETSSHPKGEAMDVDADYYNEGVTNREIFEWILDNCEFDQLIWEYGTDNDPAWVHFSYREGNNRKEVLRTIKENDELKTIPYERPGA